MPGRALVARRHRLGHLHLRPAAAAATRLVKVLVTLAVPEKADGGAAALFAVAAVCTALEVCPRPGSRVTCRCRAAWFSTAAAASVAGGNGGGRRCRAVQPCRSVGSDAADGP